MDPLDTESEIESYDEAQTTLVVHRTSSDLDTLILPQHLVNLQTAVMDSDTEITVVTIGKETPNQAFFVHQKHLSSTLQEIREALVSQSLTLPSHFKFMSSSKNMIAIPTEQVITLKKLIGLDDDIGSSNARLFICSMSSKKRKRKTSACADAQESLQNEDIGSDATNEGDIEGSPPECCQRTAAKVAKDSGRCIKLSFNPKGVSSEEDNPPFTISGSCHIEGSNSNWKVLFRALVGLAVVLIAALVLLILAFFSLTYIMSVFRNEIPTFNTETDDVTRMELKMEGLEMSYRNDLQDIKVRLAAIETHATAHSRRMAEDLATIMARFERGAFIQPTDTLPTTDAKGSQKDAPPAADKGRVKHQQNGANAADNGSGDSGYVKKQEQKTST